MKRTFLDPTSPLPWRTTIAVPHTATVTVVEHAGGVERTRRHRCDDHPAAIARYLELIDQLLASGLVEQPPALRYRRGDDWLEIAPPCLPELSYTEAIGGLPRTHTQRFASASDALASYNDHVRARVAEGFTFEVPEWHAPFEAPPDGFALHTEHDDSDPPKVSKRYYKRTEAPHDEFGPEWWYQDGHTTQYNFQLQTQQQGPKFNLEGEIPSALRSMHRNSQQGRTWSFEPDGAIKELPSGTVEVVGPEDRKVSVYSAPGVLAQITWYRLDDSLEQQKIFDEGMCTRITFYDEEGTLTQRRTRFRADRWWQERFRADGVTVSGHGALDKDNKRVGSWIELAEGEAAPPIPAFGTSDEGVLDASSVDEA